MFHIDVDDFLYALLEQFTLYLSIRSRRCRVGRRRIRVVIAEVGVCMVLSLRYVRSYGHRAYVTNVIALA